MQDRYSALVRGSSAIFPRGFLWLIPVWYTAAASLLVLSRRTPAWYTPAVLLGLLMAALSLLIVLATMRNNAFIADDQGIWLGLRAGATRRVGRRRRQVRQLPWPHIAQVEIVPRAYGAQVDILLGLAAPIVRRPNVVAEIIRMILLLVLPIFCIVCSPALLRAHRNPPRYRVKLCDADPRELRQALAALAPATVPVTVMISTRVAVYRPSAPRQPVTRH